MGQKMSRLPMNVHIFVDTHHKPKIRHKEMLDKYLRDNMDNINILFIFVKNQNPESAEAWEIFFKDHPQRQHIRVIRDLLIANDGYISSMYKLRDIPTGIGGVDLKFWCIFDTKEMPNAFSDFQEKYLAFKNKLPKHKFRAIIPRQEN